MQEIGLFPLNMVLLPQERIPLHIFEERYKELVNECLDEKQPFGLVMSDEPSMRMIGTLAEIERVDERLPDGRLNIVVHGLRRFRITEHTVGRSFHTATTEPVVDEPDPADPAEVESMLEALAGLAKAADAEIPSVAADEPELSFRLASTVELETGARQELLELTSERDRTLLLTRLFSQLARAIQRQQRARERAETNGRVEPHD